MNLPELAIPSYKRSKSISEKTLKFLSDVSYPPERITIFVATEQEAQQYYKDLSRHLYGRLVVGQPGLMEQRNFINQYYPEDSILVSMDDDIKKIDCPKDNFLDLVRDAVERIHTREAGLFGVLPNDDKRRYKDDITTHLSFIIGSFFICRIHHDIEITYPEKDDYERSILYFVKYGQVLRHRGAGVQTAYTGGTGGLQEAGRLQRMELGVKNLLERYEGYCVRSDKKGMADVSLNWRSKAGVLPYGPFWAVFKA